MNPFVQSFVATQTERLSRLNQMLTMVQEIRTAVSKGLDQLELSGRFNVCVNGALPYSVQIRDMEDRAIVGLEINSLEKVTVGWGGSRQPGLKYYTPGLKPTEGVELLGRRLAEYVHGPVM